LALSLGRMTRIETKILARAVDRGVGIIWAQSLGYDLSSARRWESLGKAGRLMTLRVDIYCVVVPKNYCRQIDTLSCAMNFFVDHQIARWLLLAFIG